MGLLSPDVGEAVRGLVITGAFGSTFQVVSPGFHAIGMPPSAESRFRIGGEIPLDSVPSNVNQIGFQVIPTMNPHPNTSSHILAISGGVIRRAASGTHGTFSGALFIMPTISGGAATITTAATVYIFNAPTAATNNYALLVDAGLSRFDGNGTHVFELPADATDPTVGGGAATGRIPVLIGGALRYLAYY